MKIDNPRMCLVSRTREPKSRLFRVVLIDGQAVVDSVDSMPGRGYYFLKKEEAIKRISPRHFKGKISEEACERLKGELYGLL